MKKLLPYILAFVLLAAVIIGQSIKSDNHSEVPPAVTMEIMDGSLGIYANAWRTEVARRFPDAVVVLAHGGTFSEGVWLVKATDYDHPTMTADQLAQHYKDLFPNRPIVMLCCNPGHLHLHVHGVYHAMDSVWCVPDRAVGQAQQNDAKLRKTLGEDRWAEDPGVSGNIFEFISD